MIVENHVPYDYDMYDELNSIKKYEEKRQKKELEILKRIFAYVSNATIEDDSFEIYFFDKNEEYLMSVRCCIKAEKFKIIVNSRDEELLQKYIKKYDIHFSFVHSLREAWEKLVIHEMNVHELLSENGFFKLPKLSEEEWKKRKREYNLILKVLEGEGE